MLPQFCHAEISQRNTAAVGLPTAPKGYHSSRVITGSQNMGNEATPEVSTARALPNAMVMFHVAKSAYLLRQ